VCVGCGAFKRRPQVRCSGCGYLPFSEYEIARALILSESFHIGGTVIGRSRPELKRIAKEIRTGRAYLFDPKEEQIALNAYRDFQTITHRKRVWNRVAWTGITLLILILLYLFL
jgi:hypothetical protein